MSLPLPLRLVLVAVVEGGWVGDSSACTCLVLNPYFGRRQFSGKRAVIRDSLARWSSRREGGSSESEFEFKRPKMLQCSRTLN